MQHIIPNLWFDKEAEEAATFYTSIFKNSKMGNVTRYTDAGKETHGRPAGSVMTVEFELNGQPFLALNGGPEFKFNESISFIISCDSQDEVDYYWDKLTEGGDEKAQICGWLKDKYGLSWQVVPKEVNELMADPDPTKAGRAMEALLKMKKIDLQEMKRAMEA